MLDQHVILVLLIYSWKTLLPPHHLGLAMIDFSYCILQGAYTIILPPLLHWRILPLYMFTRSQMPFGLILFVKRELGFIYIIFFVTHSFLFWLCVNFLLLCLSLQQHRVADMIVVLELLPLAKRKDILCLAMRICPPCRPLINAQDCVESIYELNKTALWDPWITKLVWIYALKEADAIMGQTSLLWVKSAAVIILFYFTDPIK